MNRCPASHSHRELPDPELGVPAMRSPGTTELIRGDLRPRIEAMGRELRSAISTVLEGVAGPSPRPTRVSRAIGLDKSLASRLVRAVQSTSDLDLMHLVPSPRAACTSSRSWPRVRPILASIGNLLMATERFEELLDAVPGGRASIDAQISESSHVALTKRGAHRQAGGRSSPCRSCSAFLRCGLPRRCSSSPRPTETRGRHRGAPPDRPVPHAPGAPLALLEFFGEKDDAVQENSISFDTLEGERRHDRPDWIPAARLPARSPSRSLEVIRDGQMTTLVLAGNPRCTRCRNSRRRSGSATAGRLIAPGARPDAARLRAAHALPAGRARCVHRRIDLP